MKRFLIIFPVLFLLCSCSVNTKRTEVRQIDKIYFEVSYLKHILSSYNTDSFAYYVSTINKSLDKINKKSKMTFDEDFHTHYVVPYTDAGNILSNYNSLMTKIFIEIAKSEKQLKNLQSDVNKGIISKNEFIEYFSQEKKAADMINEDVLTLKATLLYNVLLFKRIRPIINKKIENSKF